MEVGYAYYTMFNVPHVVVKMKADSDAVYEEVGKQIQLKVDANINFINYKAEGKVKEVNIRTYERGAGLTYSCGTGCSSCFYILQPEGYSDSSCVINTKGGRL